MPFRSEEQRKYMWANHPEIAKRWTERYGGAVQRRIAASQKTYSEKQSGKRNVSKRERPSAD